MITEEQIAEILSLYKKHGWTLSRVLLSAQMEKVLSDKIENLFGAAEINPSEINAAWFSRPSKNNSEAWELRAFSATPFALLEIFDADAEEDVRTEKMNEAESLLLEKLK